MWNRAYKHSLDTHEREWIGKKTSRRKGGKEKEKEKRTLGLCVLFILIATKVEVQHLLLQMSTIVAGQAWKQVHVATSEHHIKD